jgi:hypothetical protein
MSLEASFGPFAQVFKRDDLEVPVHLKLLMLREPGPQIVIERIAKALQCGNSAQWIAALFRDANWRPHLVGAIALLLQSSLDHKLLWHAVDGGSWVTPQLVVTATFVDPLFREHARSRVAALCPVVVPVGLTPAERHSATGPAGLQARSAKMLASLIAASEEFPDLAQWREGVLQDDRVKSLLAVDASWDKSDKIVRSWSAAVRDAFLARGMRLTVCAERG